jgi:hypothetical protein
MFNISRRENRNVRIPAKRTAEEDFAVESRLYGQGELNFRNPDHSDYDPIVDNSEATNISSYRTGDGESIKNLERSRY